MPKAPQADAIVLFGGAGDLALRMLFPSLYFLDADGFLPDGFKIVAAARAEIGRGAFEAMVRDAVTERANPQALDEDVWSRFVQRLDYRAVDATKADRLSAITEALGEAKAPIFYLALSPSLYVGVCQALAGAGLISPQSRIVLEKPIGHDLESSRGINAALAEVFEEEQVFRIDHYLGKETVQNLIALRFANTLFEPLWNNLTIDHVQITVAETEGVGDRWPYYDEHGALRDMIQNHVLQLLCLVAMEPPSDMEAESLRNEKVKVLRSLRPFTRQDVAQASVRGQYAAGVAQGQSAPAYEEERGQESATETFVALRVEVANRLVIDLQPDEDIELLLMNKAPGISQGGMRLQSLPLSLSLLRAYSGPNARRRIAYERLILDVILGNSALFVRRDEVEQAWRWVDGVAEAWAEAGMAPKPYAAGSWGPAGAFALIERAGRAWYD
ncbi:MAG: glucose-6-phosphate dehydrogenase [Caulobacterales bacterium 32-67-6]|nr:MAG: glucose-6-phosphate dehydrogenase [Caulobacterales bacterium 32-67-6]